MRFYALANLFLASVLQSFTICNHPNSSELGWAYLGAYRESLLTGAVSVSPQEYFRTHSRFAPCILGRPFLRILKSSEIWENGFDFLPQAKQLACLGTHTKTALSGGFCTWVPIGNRTLAKGSTSLCANRYTIGTMIELKHCVRYHS